MARSRRLGGSGGADAAGRGQNIHATLRQFGGHGWQPVLVSLRPPVFDGDILPLAIADLLKSSPECRQP
jgi:hypothetical protein